MDSASFPEQAKGFLELDEEKRVNIESAFQEEVEQTGRQQRDHAFPGVKNTAADGAFQGYPGQDDLLSEVHGDGAGSDAQQTEGSTPAKDAESLQVSRGAATDFEGHTSARPWLDSWATAWRSCLRTFGLVISRHWLQTGVPIGSR